MLTSFLLYSATLLLSLSLSLYLTPKMRTAAIRFAILDRPNSTLKTHSTATPYLGGVAVYLSFLITLSLVFEFSAPLLGLLLGCTIVTMLGLFDDLKAISPVPKLLGQCLAASVLIKCGIAIQLSVLPEIIALLLTLFWVIGVTNALNIIDVSDGLSSGITAIAAGGFAVIAALNHDALFTVTSLALMGAFIGFLQYNRPPATIYLGDTGSLLAGFSLAALGIHCSYTANHMVGIAAPVLLLIVPIFDTTLVTMARIKNGISPLSGSPDHFAVRLRHHGWAARKIALYGYGLGITGSICGIILILSPPTQALIILIIATLFYGGNMIWLWTTKAPHKT